MVHHHSKPRSKNVIPNALRDIEEQVKHHFSIIPYRSQPKRVKLVEILILCLQARVLLPQDRLDHFKRMIQEVTMKKIQFQRKRDQDAWRRKNIQLMEMVQSMAVTVLEKGEQCLPQLLGNYFAYQAEGTGKQGRGRIQARKVTTALYYIRTTMTEMFNPFHSHLQHLEVMEVLENHSEESTQISLLTQEIAQIRVDARSDDSGQERILQAEQGQQGRVNLNEDMLKELMDFRLHDVVLWDPMGSEMEFVSDLLERKQKEEIQYEFLCNSTTTQYGQLHSWQLYSSEEEL